MAHFGATEARSVSGICGAGCVLSPEAPLSGTRSMERVKISKETDMRLKPSGKRCAPAGMPNLPGGMMRCHSMPGAILTCPTGWLAEDGARRDLRGRQHVETLRATSAHSASLHDGTWSALEGTIRPNTVALERCAGGGRTQGARSMRPMTEGAVHRGMYDSRFHGWHDPRGQLEATRLNEPVQPRSWAWTMRKARDHLGYGADGMVSTGDVQGTAVSGDNPDWFVGTRTVPGPFSTKTVPVKRCPFVHIEGKQVRVRAKSFNQGDYLDCNETMHDDHRVPPKAKRKAFINPMETVNRAKLCSLQSGGCVPKAGDITGMSQHITKEGRTQKL